MNPIKSTWAYRGSVAIVKCERCKVGLVIDDTKTAIAPPCDECGGRMDVRRWHPLVRGFDERLQ